MATTKMTLFGSLLWAAAFITSTFVLGDDPRGKWVEGSLLLLWIIFLSFRAGRGSRSKKS